MLNKNLFLKINMLTIGSVLVLILVGSIVRTLGAGMGCPDWPKCFGSYIPPTSKDQLPVDYLEIFKEKRLAKNDRLASFFVKFGYSQLADKIQNDPFIQEEQSFDATKAWVEYINRLVGVLIGLFVVLNAITAFSIKKNKWVPFVGIVILLLTVFQGWVGSLVVSTNLLKGFITFHMLLALLIVALLLWMNTKAKDSIKTKDRMLYFVVLGLLVLLIPQIVLGTEVRALIDPLLVNEPNRSRWVTSLTNVFFIHRSYSWLLLIGAIVTVFIVFKKGYNDLKLPSATLVGTVISSAIAGIVMVNFDFPAWAQAFHLLVAAIIFSLVFYLILKLKPTT